MVLCLAELCTALPRGRWLLPPFFFFAKKSGASENGKQKKYPITDDLYCAGEGARARGTVVRTARERRGRS